MKNLIIGGSSNLGSYLINSSKKDYFDFTYFKKKKINGIQFDILKGNKKDEIYIYLVSKMYNLYVSEVKDDLLNFEFIVPEFFDKDKFKINTELIENKQTKEYIEEDQKLEYIFKVILGSFNKKKKKPIGIFTENTVILFNRFVDDINKYIEIYLNKIHEVELNRAGLLDFDDFFSIKYDTDAASEVYPDVYNKFVKGFGEDKKK